MWTVVQAVIWLKKRANVWKGGDIRRGRGKRGLVTTRLNTFWSAWTGFRKCGYASGVKIICEFLNIAVSPYRTCAIVRFALAYSHNTRDAMMTSINSCICDPGQRMQLHIMFFNDFVSDVSLDDCIYFI